MNRYICIHGHFYQPPRENPWLEVIETQDSAYPFKDWNDRITAECYAPNTASRILDGKNCIIDIVNNYSKISFNFGPTLLTWLEKYSPETYEGILEADRESQKNFSGHGSAMAQVYNHIIMPLANREDKVTQIHWGIEDFKHRFKRDPEGMWLAETAVDLETLDLLVDYGIKFTVLSPYQAQSIRELDSQKDDWYDVSGGKVDPKKPYWCLLPSGRKIAIFFYDGPISQDIAFGGLLSSGERLAGRMMGAFSDDTSKPQLVHFANDGETFGHHHKFANMALSYALAYIEREKFSKITIYPEYLEKFPPDTEVKIFENSAWSCAHGVGRWFEDCGCHTGGPEDWNQKWRTPLRDSLNFLRDEIADIFEVELKKHVDDPWQLRNEYIYLILDRDGMRLNEFFEKFNLREIFPDDKIKILKLLEAQKHAMFMFTSCGWFFNDISGLEPVQILQYAARAIQLTQEFTEKDLEEIFLTVLEKAQSNLPEMGTGRDIYNRFVKPSVVSLLDVAADYAISLLFQEYPQDVEFYSYKIRSLYLDKQKIGKQQLVLGRVSVDSTITTEESKLDFVVLHLGDLNLSVGVRPAVDDSLFDRIQSNIREAFLQSSVLDAVKLIRQYFDENEYSFWSLFKNEQTKAMSHIFEDTLESIEFNFRQIHDQYYPLMHSSQMTKAPLPKALAMVVEFILNRDLQDVIENQNVNLKELEKIVSEIKKWNFTRDKQSLSLRASARINALMLRLKDDPKSVNLVQTIESVIRILNSLELELDLWKAQNIYFELYQNIYQSNKDNQSISDGDQKIWNESFEKIGEYLQIKVRSK